MKTKYSQWQAPSPSAKSFSRHRPLRLLGALLLWGLAQVSWGAACDAVFTNGVQSHSSTGQVSLGDRVDVSGGDTVLDTVDLTASASASCGGGTCTASGSPSASNTLTLETGSGADGPVNATGNRANNVGAGDYTSVSVANNSRITFNSTDDYLMHSFITGNDSDIRLTPGDYWIDGDVTWGLETQLRRQSGGGTRRVFIAGDLSIGDRFLASGFGPDELLVYVGGTINIGNDVELSGFLYANGAVTIGDRLDLSGAVSGSAVSMGNDSEVTYEGGVLPGAAFEPFCGPDVASGGSLVAEWRMNELQWEGTGNEVRDASGNGNHGTAQGGTMTDQVDPARAGNPGTCGYGQLNGSDGYLAVPNLSDTLNATASLAFWIKTEQTGNDVGWQAPGVAGVEQEGGANDIFWGWLDGAGRIGVSVGNDYATKSTTSINDGGWHHVVLMRDVAAGQYQIYIDGTLDASGPISGASVTTGYSSIGRIEDTGGTSEYLEGELDEVRLYSDVLSAEQVTEIFNDVHPCSSTLCPSGNASSGMRGEYYDNQTLSGEVAATQVDGPIDFIWEDGAGPSVLGGRENDFSVRWEGRLYVTESNSYQFRTYSDDGVRLWVNGEQLIDSWTNHAVQEDTSAGVDLVAGESYDIVLEFYENVGRAEISLLWDTVGGGPENFTLIPSGNSSGTAAGLYHCLGTEVAYYTLDHSANGVTCEAQPVTVTARDADGNALAPVAGTEIVMEATPADANTSWADGNTYVFSGSEDFTIKYLRQTSPATLDLSVTDGTASGSSGPIAFADTGLRFYADRGGAPLPDQVAAQNDPDPVLRAVRTDDETGSCLARVADQTRPVGLGFECRNPDSCIAGQTLTLNSEAVQANNLGEAPSYTSLDLAFDSEGYADIPLNYSDVGTVRLLGQLDLPEEDEQPAITLTAASNEFVVRPYSLAVISAQDGSGTANPGTTAGGAGFVASGEAFSLTLQARNANGDPTPNFGNENPAQNARVELANLAYPSGGALGNLGAPENFAPEPNGQALNNLLTWDNVGTITLTPRLRGDDYQGAGDLVELTESDPIGRFYPFDYVLGGASVTDACGSFSYMDQPGINLDYTVNARNAFGGTTTNYDNTDQATPYAGVAIPGYVAEDSDSGNGSALSVRVEVADFTWDDGVLIGLDPSATFRRALNTRPDGPWSDLQWGLQLTDALDARELTGLDMNAATSGDCASAGNCTAVALGTPLSLRFGRLRLNDAYGPEVVDLPVPFFTEYWDGTEFVRNVEDSCTLIPREAINYPGGTLADDGNRTVAVGGGTTRGEYANLDAGGVNFLASDADHSFTAPGRGNTGNFEVQIDLVDRRWLRFDWNQNGDYSDDIQMPPATIGFGSYRGHDRIIYWREVLE